MQENNIKLSGDKRKVDMKKSPTYQKLIKAEQGKLSKDELKELIVKCKELIVGHTLVMLMVGDIVDIIDKYYLVDRTGNPFSSLHKEQVKGLKRIFVKVGKIKEYFDKL